MDFVVVVVVVVVDVVVGHVVVVACLIDADLCHCRGCLRVVVSPITLDIAGNGVCAVLGAHRSCNIRKLPS